MILNFVLVFLLGVAIAVVVMSRLSAGTLKVYVPVDVDEEPYLYVELDNNVGSLIRKKYVMFRVNTKNIKTQK